MKAFHGNTVSVYLKPAGSPAGIVRAKWTRHVLDVFGPLNEKHTGSIHQVVCADIDGDGVDEFLVAMMGADPPDFQRTGVWCYKRELGRGSAKVQWLMRFRPVVDRKEGNFSKTKISSISAGRIATANFHSSSSEVVRCLFSQCKHTPLTCLHPQGRRHYLVLRSRILRVTEPLHQRPLFHRHPCREVGRRGVFQGCSCWLDAL